MSKNLKRIIAYMLDMFLVTAIVFALTNIKQINFQLNDHNKISKQYSEVVKKYEKEETKFNKVKKKYENKKIKKSEYKEAEKNFDNYKKEYAKDIKKYNYKLSNSSILATIMSISVVVLYFGVLQYFMHGQTLGKKLLKIKVIKNKEGNLSILNFILRCIILNGVIANIIIVIFVKVLSVNDFYNASYIVSNMQSIIELIILIMIFMTADNRGLHDYIANTKIVEIDSSGNIVEEQKQDLEEVKDDKVIEAEVEEVKESNNKKKVSKKALNNKNNKTKKYNNNKSNKKNKKEDE